MFETFPADHINRLKLIAERCVKRGELTEAETLYRDVVALLEEYSDQPIHRLPVLYELATVLEVQNKRNELIDVVQRIRKVLFERAS